MISNDVGNYSFQIDFKPLNRVEHQKTEVLVEPVKVNDVIEIGTISKNVAA
ncbi:hypothetical protein D3C81_2199950 [compost metagenome]